MGWSDQTDKAVLSSGEDKGNNFGEAFVVGLLSCCRCDCQGAGGELGLARLRTLLEGESALQRGVRFRRYE